MRQAIVVIYLFAAFQAFAAEPTFTSRREKIYDFEVDLSFVDRPKLSIQYFYLLLNGDKSFHKDDPVRSPVNPADQALKLDTGNQLAAIIKAEPDDEKEVFIVIGKMAYVLDQDISLFKNPKAMFDPKFLLAMNPKMSKFKTTSDTNRFMMIAPHVLPNARLTVTHWVDPVDHPEKITDAGAQEVLKQDLRLGKPEAVVSYYFDDFTHAALFFRACQASYSYLKFYKLKEGRTLVVENVVVLPFGTLGGPEGMRKSALEQVAPKAKTLREYKPAN